MEEFSLAEQVTEYLINTFISIASKAILKYFSADCILPIPLKHLGQGQ